MRYLKNRILRAAALRLRKGNLRDLIPLRLNDGNECEAPPEVIRKSKKNKSHRSANPNFKTKSTKNIIKNYARAIILFGVSDSARAHIEDVIKESNLSVSTEEFVAFISPLKEQITSSAKFRELLIVNEGC